MALTNVLDSIHSKGDLSNSEIQQIKDKFQVHAITPLNLEFPQSMRRLLEIEPSSKYGEKNAIARILSGDVHKSFETGITFLEIEDKKGAYRYSLEHPSIDHLFDNHALFSCTLQPEGRYKEQAAILINDPYSAFIHARKITKAASTKVAISYNFVMQGCEGMLLGNFPLPILGPSKDLLIIDDVNGDGKNLPRSWKHDYALAHERMARHVNSQLIVYGTEHGTNKDVAARMDEHIAHKIQQAAPFTGFVIKRGAIPFFTPAIHISGLKPYGIPHAGIYQGIAYPTPKK